MEQSALQTWMWCSCVLNEVKAVVKTELGQVTDKLKEEIDELRGTVHDMQLENETLKNELVKIRSEREIESDNIISAKHRSIENDQYARRTNIVIYGIKEKDKENTVELVRETIKDKLKMSLNKDEIEVCHRLSPQTRGKVRPIVVRFRFRDTKWDVMKCRKNLKGTGIVFSEDLCKEMRELLKELHDVCIYVSGGLTALLICAAYSSWFPGGKWSLRTPGWEPGWWGGMVMPSVHPLCL